MTPVPNGNEPVSLAKNLLLSRICKTCYHFWGYDHEGKECFCNDNGTYRVKGTTQYESCEKWKENNKGSNSKKLLDGIYV